MPGTAEHCFSCPGFLAVVSEKFCNINVNPLNV